MSCRVTEEEREQLDMIAVLRGVTVSTMLTLKARELIAEVYGKQKTEARS